MKNNLMLIREAFFFSQKQIAELLQMNIYGYDSVEKGMISPSPLIIKMLSKIYAIPENFFEKEERELTSLLEGYTTEFKNLNQEERFKKAVANLLGNTSLKGTFSRISKVRKRICEEIELEEAQELSQKS